MTVYSIVDLDTEANEICVQAIPGAVFLRLRHTEDGTVVRRMFVEMNVPEARELVDELLDCVRQAERRQRR